MDKNFYNQASGAKLGWDPAWFGEKYFDDKLVRAIKKWQRVRQLVADGLCGPMTFRRIWTERQAKLAESVTGQPFYSHHIVNNGVLVPIAWDKVVLWTDEGGIAAREGSYYSYAGRSQRKIRYFVNHWDVCLSSHMCATLLDKRGVSVHFLIDNDGTIYQTLDMQHAAWHAGSSRTNRASVGVEITNAYYPKYQDIYVERGFGERPVVDDAWVHGNKLDPFLGFYPQQLEALKALWQAIHATTGIPYETPENQFGKTSTVYQQNVVYGNFTGFVSHYHLTKRKIDCAGLDLKKLLEEVKDE
jgi:peptidoglycan hydrolase-like protein with peptidoglycan-binding domain